MDLMLIDLLESSKAIGLCPMGISTVLSSTENRRIQALFKTFE